MSEEKLYCIVDEVTGKEVLLGGKSYYKCSVIADSNKIVAYLSTDIKSEVRNGDVIVTRKYYLTNERTAKPTFVKGKLKLIVALRIEDWQITDEYEKSKYLKVKVEGYITKSKFVTIKKVGESGIDFLPLSFAAYNEDNEQFEILACCFGRIAKQVEGIVKPEKVSIYARVKKSKYDATFELAVEELKFINKEND